MKDGFDYMITCYFGKKTLEIYEWTAKETYAVLNHIANIRTITATTLEPNSGEFYNRLGIGRVVSTNINQLMPKLQYFIRKIKVEHMFLEIFIA